MKSDRSKKSKSSSRPPASKSSASSAARKQQPVKAASAKEQPSRKAAVPPILLEGDEAPAMKRSGPGERYAVGTAEVGAPSETLNQALPEAYGTRKVLLFARDPEWLYVHWDYTAEQLQECNSKSADRHMTLRVHRDQEGETPFAEIHVHPESRHWFVHVAQAGTRFVVELGYYTRQRKWKRESISAPALTPPNDVSPDRTVRFATLPMEVSMRQLVTMVKHAASGSQPLVDVIQSMRGSGHPELPPPGPIASAQWTPLQDRALAEVLSIDSVRRVWIGSLEITELVRRQLANDLSSASAAQFSMPSSLDSSSLSSPFGGAERRKGFWFNVNAELIIYGATEPDAQVTIGGRVIQLRPDGSFSYRFALPDGQFDLPAVAISNDRTDSRTAKLRFSRRTDYTGKVDAHPQDPALRPPTVANIR